MEEKFHDNPEVYKKKAKLLKLLAHPQRLCIVKSLCVEECASVKEMQACLEQEQAVVSQHLAKLRNAKLIKCEREGTCMKYSIYDEGTKDFITEVMNALFSK